MAAHLKPRHKGKQIPISDGEDDVGFAPSPTSTEAAEGRAKNLTAEIKAEDDAGPTAQQQQSDRYFDDDGGEGEESEPGTLASRCFKAGVGGVAAFYAYQVLGLEASPAIPPLEGYSIALLVGLSALGLLFARQEPLKLPKDVRKTFVQLSILELSLTVALPIYALRGVDNESTTAAILCPHLFAFLTQIVVESWVSLAGPSRRYLLFPYTLVFNLYRAWPLLRAALLITALLQKDPASVPKLAFLVHTFAVMLWVYSTFSFCVMTWSPYYKFPKPEVEEEEPKGGESKEDEAKKED